ncbi:MAG: DUF3857 domain-containing protein, partial [Bacteroidota bacterium]|nr:DUF3857 domain-containing protein [Bacteroidota bacterium]
MRKTVLTIILLASIRICFGGNPMQDLIRNAGNASDYPSDNLVVIFDSIRTDVKESGLSYVTTHTLTKILTAKGAVDQSTVKFGYDPLSAYVDIKKVVIYKNDGTIRELDPSKTMDYPAPARMIYWGAREKMMAIGRLEPGDAVEVIGFRKGFTYALLGQ